MARKMRYYRTAALLGPQEQHAAYRAKRRRPIKVPWQLVVVLVSLIGLGLWVGMSNAWYLEWDDISVVGVTSLEAGYHIRKASDLWGYHRFMLKPKTAQTALVAALPEYKDIGIHCGLFPTRCRIEVTQRTPVMAWSSPPESFWVDDNWVLYPVLGDRPDLPVVNGPVPVMSETYTDTVKGVYLGIQSLSALGVKSDALDYVPQRGLVWTDPEGRRVAFGVGPHMAPRLKMYEVLIRHCAAEGIHPQVVDARFPGGATYSEDRTW